MAFDGTPEEKAPLLEEGTEFKADEPEAKQENSLDGSCEVDSMSYDARMLVTFNVLRSLGGLETLLKSL